MMLTVFSWFRRRLIGRLFVVKMINFELLFLCSRSDFCIWVWCLANVIVHLAAAWIKKFLMLLWHILKGSYIFWLQFKLPV